MHKHTLIHTASALGIALPLSLAASLPAAAQSQLIDNFQSGGALLTQNAPHRRQLLHGDDDQLPDQPL